MTQACSAGFLLSVLGQMFPNKEQGMFIDWVTQSSRNCAISALTTSKSLNIA